MESKKRRKSALGCFTCKTRKVKCDEQKPSCQRCLSTGRVCDGYPIQPQARERRPGLLLAIPVTQQLRTENDHRAFQQFVQLVPSLTNFASTELWNTYILQLSHAEAGIHHIVLCVGHLLSTHTPVSGETAVIKRQKQQMIYYHYGKALHALVHNSNPDVCLVLLSCLIFCLFEELRGNYYAAIQHIVAGRDIILKHIRMRKPATRSDDLARVNTPSGWNPLLAQLLQVYKSIETHIAVLESRALTPVARLPLSGFTQQDVESYRRNRRRLCWESHHSLSSSDETAESSLPDIANMDDASRSLAGLASIRFMDTKLNSSSAQPVWHTAFFLCSRRALLLNQWLEAINRMMSTYTAKTITIIDRVNCHILRLYHSCLAFITRAEDLGQETIFDENKVMFDNIMFRVTILFAVVQEELIPPLFFVATRCRVGYIRRNAIVFLRRCGVEGGFLADIAELVIEIEESNQLGQDNGTEEEQEQEINTFGLPGETARLRLHGLKASMVPGENIFQLMVSTYPYHPRIPHWSVLFHPPLVQENGLVEKAGRILERALDFEICSLVS